MPNTIQDLLDNISNARYGADVRSSIHDAIEMCYDNTASGKTTAEAAAEAAATAVSDAVDLAEEKAALANTNAGLASDAADLANEKAGLADEKASLANAKAELADTKAGLASDAADAANDAADAANDAADTASAAAGRAEEAISSISDAVSRASNAVTNAETALNNAASAKSQLEKATGDYTTLKYEVNAMKTSLSRAATEASAAAELVENLTVSYEDVGPSGTAQAVVSEIDDHYNIHFKLKQGETGAANIVKGSAYETLADLEADITNPAVGDQYNVGDSAPYNIYRWTGDDWEDQGQIGVNISDLSNAELDTLWNETAVSSSTSKYVNHTGLLYLIVNKIKAALSNKVDKDGNKVLSSNNFTNTYKNQITTNANNIASLTANKVDAITGYGLSKNDFSDIYVAEIQAHENALNALTPSVVSIINVNSTKIEIARQHCVLVGNLLYINLAFKVNPNQTVGNNTTVFTLPSNLKAVASSDVIAVTNLGSVVETTSGGQVVVPYRNILFNIGADKAELKTNITDNNTIPVGPYYFINDYIHVMPS